MPLQNPNYTKVPNDLFEAMRKMEKAELKIVLTVIRNTIGYHRSEFTSSLRKMAEATGLTLSSVQVGSQSASDHGWITMTKTGHSSIRWSLRTEHIVNDQDPEGVPITDTDVPTVGTPMYQLPVQPVPVTGTQSGLKKVLNKDIKGKAELKYTPAQKLFLDIFDAKRLNQIQLRDIAKWEETYPIDKIRTALEWARRIDMPRGKAIAAVTTALLKWDDKKKDTLPIPSQKGIDDWLKEKSSGTS